MKLRVLAPLTLLMLFAAFLFLVSQKSGSNKRESKPLAPVPSHDELRFTHSQQCRTCHEQIYDEWNADQHATAWTEAKYVSFTEEHTRVECLSCHAPQPMLTVGVTNEPQLRSHYREDGVDCITCHVHDGRTFGSIGTGAICGGTKHEVFNDSMACYHCHSAHNLFKEYLASEHYQKGITCQDCHMEQVTRPIAKDGPARLTRRHTMHAGAHDTEALKKVLTLDLQLEGDELVVTIVNVGAAHGVPGEINNRVVRLEVSIQIPKGKQEVFGEIIEVVDEVAAYQAFFTPPARFLRDKVPSTQLMPNQPRILRYPVPVKSGKIKAFLEFKLEKDLFDPPVRMVEKELEF